MDLLPLALKEGQQGADYHKWRDNNMDNCNTMEAMFARFAVKETIRICDAPHAGGGSGKLPGGLANINFDEAATGDGGGYNLLHKMQDLMLDEERRQRELQQAWTHAAEDFQQGDSTVWRALLAQDIPWQTPTPMQTKQHLAQLGAGRPGQAYMRARAHDRYNGCHRCGSMEHGHADPECQGIISDNERQGLPPRTCRASWTCPPVPAQTGAAAGPAYGRTSWPAGAGRMLGQPAGMPPPHIPSPTAAGAQQRFAGAGRPAQQYAYQRPAPPGPPPPALHSLAPLYAVNSDQASWWSIGQQSEEERLVANSLLAARDVVIDRMAQELARYTSNLDTLTLHQLAQMLVPVQQAVPVKMQPLLLANRAPSDFEWTGYYRDGRTRLYQPQADARVTAAAMEGRSGAGAARDADMFYDVPENI